MRYHITGDTDCPLVEIYLQQGESAKIERGCMVYMRDIDLQGKLNAGKSVLGGLISAVARSATSGESMFITQATATSSNARLGIAPANPGRIVDLQVGPAKQYRLNTSVFLGCDDTVSYNMVRQNVSNAIFAGTGGLFVMETSGEGTLLVSAFGDLLEIDITPDKPLTIDNYHVVAWDSSLNYSVEVASGAFGFMSGEGLVNKFTGSGKVYIQTRNIQSLAEQVRPFIPDRR